MKLNNLLIKPKKKIIRICKCSNGTKNGGCFSEDKQINTNFLSKERRSKIIYDKSFIILYITFSMFIQLPITIKKSQFELIL